MGAFSVGAKVVTEVTPISTPQCGAGTGRRRSGICDPFSDIPPHQFGTLQWDSKGQRV